MRHIVIYYSYTGKTEKIAKEIAAREKSAILKIEDKKRPAAIKAYTCGIISAIRMKKWPVKPVDADLSVYDKITVIAPVWASNPAPASLGIFDLLPQGSQVEVIMVSASGSSECEEKAERLIKQRGCVMTSFKDVK